MFLEKLKDKAFLIFVWAVSIRILVEGVLEKEKAIGFNSPPFTSLQIAFSHHFLYYLFLFSFVALFLSLYFKRNFESTLELAFLSSVFLITVPFFDFFVTKGKGLALTYITDKNYILKDFLTGFNIFVKSKFVSPGQKFTFYLYSFLLFFYFRFFEKEKPIKILLFLPVLYLIIFFSAVFPLFFSLIFNKEFSDVFTTGGFFLTDTQKFAVLFGIPVVLLFFIKKFKKIDANFVYYIFFLLSGFFISYLFIGKHLVFPFKNPTDYLLIPGLIVFAFVLNYIEKQKDYIFYFLFFSLSLSFGFYPFYISVIIFLFNITFSFVYLREPVNFFLLFVLSSSFLFKEKTFLMIPVSFYISFFVLFFIYISIDLIDKKYRKISSFFKISIFLFFVSIIFYIAFLKGKSKEKYYPYIIGSFYYERGNYDQAILYLEKVLELSPLSFFYIGESHYKLKNYKKAIYYLEKALKLKFYGEKYYSILFSSYFNEKDYNKAYFLIDSIIKRGINIKRAFLEKGIVLYHNKDITGSLRNFFKSFFLGGDDVYLFSYIGKAFIEKRDFLEAEFWLKKALEKEEDFYISLAELGRVYMMKGDYEKSEIFFKKALNKNSSSPSLWNNYGVLLLKKGEIGRAKRAFLKALDISPSYLPAMKNLYLLKLKQER